MGETVIDTNSLKGRLKNLGLDRIIILSLSEEKDNSGNPIRNKINDYITSINFELKIDPISNWKRAIGKFYCNEKYHDEADWRVKELSKLFETDNIISYFMGREPTFRLSNEDNLTIVRSMITHITDITCAGIPINFIGKNEYNFEVMQEVERMTRDVEFKPYVIGRDNYFFLKDEEGVRDE